MRGVTSVEMLLCASNEDYTRQAQSLSPESAAARAWSAAMEGMKTRAPDGVASWEDLAMETSCGGACTSSVLSRVR